MVEYQGIKIYGSPITACRVERRGEKFYSDGFERVISKRKEIFDKIPEDLDILLTHVPPRGMLSYDKVNCEVL